MSVEKRRRLKKKPKAPKGKEQGDTTKKRRGRGMPKKELTIDEIEARKKAQRLGMFDKKKNLHKR